ncbi:MAG: acyl-CoA dehydrogenase family protein [Actinobacteria bacterium]|nr:acyl-CoA dehydrogenase family protein [Actinomycetota bacterium]
MIEWSETDRLIRDTIREFVDKEIRPHVDELEHGDIPPYELIRKFFSTFGIDAMARDSFDPNRTGARGDSGREALSLIAVSELSRVCMGLVTAMGVSVGLAGGTIMSRGTPEQKTRWARDLLTFDKIGAWAITEPDSGSDAFGGMKSVARRDGDQFVLNGQKTFITNGPYAETLVVYAKLDGEVATFVLDSGMPGLTQSKPLRKMGIHSSPTGQLFFDDIRLEPERLLSGGGKESARANFTTERFGVAAMSLGIIEECLRLCVDYARSRTLWGKPIGDFQLIQLKLATMEVARLNVQNLVFRTIELLRAGRTPTLAEASAIKLYSSQAATDAAMEAVQLFGGNGYMAEYRVEQLARDAKSLMIYAGSNEVQVTHIARDLLGDR